MMAASPRSSPRPAVPARQPTVAGVAEEHADVARGDDEQDVRRLALAKEHAAVRARGAARLCCQPAQVGHGQPGEQATGAHRSDDALLPTPVPGAAARPLLQVHACSHCNHGSIAGRRSPVELAPAGRSGARARHDLRRGPNTRHALPCGDGPARRPNCVTGAKGAALSRVKGGRPTAPRSCQVPRLLVFVRLQGLHLAVRAAVRLRSGSLAEGEGPHELEQALTHGWVGDAEQLCISSNASLEFMGLS